MKRTNRDNEKKYKKMLAKVRRHLRELADEQRYVALLIDPDPNDPDAQIQERAHLWERRPEDPDFLAVRVGKGKEVASVRWSRSTQRKRCRLLCNGVTMNVQ